MIIKYNNKIYNFTETPYISLHHNIIIFYETILKKEFHYSETDKFCHIIPKWESFYISYLLYKKEYSINNDENKELLNKNSLFNKNINTIYLEIHKLEEKDLFEIIIPYVKIIIISLLIIIRIDVFLSTTFNNHIKSFEDYYILLLYLLIISICIIIPYYSYKIIARFIQYVIKHLDKDIGIFMNSYIESYHIVPYNEVNYVDLLVPCNKVVDKYKKIFLEEEIKEDK